MTKQITIIGSAISKCGRLAGCELAPGKIIADLETNGLHIKQQIYNYNGESHDVSQLKDYFNQVAAHGNQLNLNQEFPIYLGGDHSCAIGSWSGISHNLQQHAKDFALIWVDAHMDAHRPETSESGNLHGMPVAHLLGHGYKELISLLNDNPKLKPENLVYFGVRSFEAPEEELLQALGVKIYYQHMLSTANFEDLFISEFNRLAMQTNGNVGISLDLDALDPKEIVAVGVPESNGIASQLFLDTFAKLDVKQLVAFEVSEYNPLLDPNGESLAYTNKLLTQLIKMVTTL